MYSKDCSIIRYNNIPPWILPPKKAETCRRPITCLYSTVSNYSAVVGICTAYFTIFWFFRLLLIPPFLHPYFICYFFRFDFFYFSHPCLTFFVVNLFTTLSLISRPTFLSRFTLYFSVCSCSFCVLFSLYRWPPAPFLCWSLFICPVIFSPPCLSRFKSQLLLYVPPVLNSQKIQSTNTGISVSQVIVSPSCISRSVSVIETLGVFWCVGIYISFRLQMVNVASHVRDTVSSLSYKMYVSKDGTINLLKPSGNFTYHQV
jgi:hypothetical protein